MVQLPPNKKKPVVIPMKIQVKFNSTEAPFVSRAAQDCGLDVDSFCKAAIFYAIRAAYQSQPGSGVPEQAATQGVSNGGHNAESGVNRGDTSEASNGGATDTDALSNSSNPLA